MEENAGKGVIYFFDLDTNHRRGQASLGPLAVRVRLLRLLPLGLDSRRLTANIGSNSDRAEMGELDAGRPAAEIGPNYNVDHAGWGMGTVA